MTCIEQSVQQEQDTHYFQGHTGHLPIQTTFWTVKEAPLKFKRIQVVQSMLSNQSGIKL